jgi:putative peptidoglycan lipid II flippase
VTKAALVDTPAPATESRSSSSIPHGLASATGALAIAVVVGQLVTIAREIFVSSQVGVDVRLDAVLVALVAPMTLAGVLQSGTSAALVAALGVAEATEGHAAARRLAGAVLTWATILGVVLTLVVIALAGPAVALAGPGLAASTAQLAVGIMPVVAPIVLFSALGVLLAAVCQSASHFRPLVVGAIVAPVVSAILTIGLWDSVGVEALGIGMTGNAIATVVVIGVGAWLAGLLPRPTLSIRRHEGADFLRHATPLWASSAALTSNQVSDRAVASLVGAGTVSALRYGETVMRVPINSLGSAWGTVVYPALVRSQAETAGLGATASSLIRVVIALAMPLTFGAAALAPLIVDIAYVRGAFTEEDARRTSEVVASLAPLFVLSMIQPVVIGSHNARRSGWTLFMAGVVTAVLNLGLDLLLAPILGVAGIGLSSSLALLLPLSALVVLLARREVGMDLPGIASVTVRSAVAAAVPAAIVGWFAWHLVPTAELGLDVLQLVAGSIAGLAGYLVGAHLLGIVEVDRTVRAATRRVRARLVRR